MKAFVIPLFTLVSSAALAATVDDFSPNSACTGTACTPFINSAPGIAVSYVDPDFSGTVIVTVNGITFRGPVVYASNLIAQDTHHLKQLWHYDNNILTAADGSTLLLTLDVYRDSPPITGGHDLLATTYTVLSGTVTLP
jgi:hypothetical protein